MDLAFFPVSPLGSGLSWSHRASSCHDVRTSSPQPPPGLGQPWSQLLRADLGRGDDSVAWEVSGPTRSHAHRAQAVKLMNWAGQGRGLLAT